MNSTRRRFVLGTGAIGGSIVAGGFGAPAGADTSDPEGFLSVFGKRQTVRRYKPDPVPDEHIRKILDAARRGPTTMNQQPWVFLVVRDRAKIDAMKARVLGRLDAGAMAEHRQEPRYPS